MQGSSLDAKITPGLEPAARGDMVQPLHCKLGEKLEPELKDSPKEIFLEDSPKKLQQLNLSFPSPSCDTWMYNVGTKSQCPLAREHRPGALFFDIR